MAIDINGNILSASIFDLTGNTIDLSTIVTNGLVMWLDPSYTSSYFSSGTYYDCGYGCQYYASSPGCTNCSTQIKDLSGNGNDGALTNGATISYSNGTGGGTMYFNGTTQYVAGPNLGSMYTQGTICMWINASAMSNYNNCFTTNYLGTNVGFRFEENASGNFGVVIGNDGGTYIGYNYISSGIATNTWYHITFVWNTSASTVVGYLNGTQVFSNSTSLFASQLPSIAIGNGFSSSRYWNGAVNSVQIYNKCLISSEVTQNYNAGRMRFGL